MNKLLSIAALIGAISLALPAFAQTVGPVNVIALWSAGVGSWFACDNGVQYYVRTDDIDYAYELSIIKGSYNNFLFGFPPQTIKFTTNPVSSQVVQVHTPWPGGS